MARTAYHHGDLYQQAHEQALAIVREQGDSAISLRALARQIGVSTPALYRHYADRESLLAELAISGFQTLRQHLLAVDQQDSRSALIGIGLIGSSLAQVARERGLVKEIAISTRSADTLQRAEELGLGDSYALDAAVAVETAKKLVARKHNQGVPS